MLGQAMQRNVDNAEDLCWKYIIDPIELDNNCERLPQYDIPASTDNLFSGVFNRQTSVPKTIKVMYMQIRF